LLGRAWWVGMLLAEMLVLGAAEKIDCTILWLFALLRACLLLLLYCQTAAMNAAVGGSGTGPVQDCSVGLWCCIALQLQLCCAQLTACVLCGGGMGPGPVIVLYTVLEEGSDCHGGGVIWVHACQQVIAAPAWQLSAVKSLSCTGCCQP